MAFVRGRIVVYTIRDLNEWIDSRRQSSTSEHWEKPAETYERIEELLPGPYVELFARTRWAGWESWETNLTKECAAIRERAFLICSRPRRPDAGNAGNEGVSRPCRRTKS